MSIKFTEESPEYLKKRGLKQGRIEFKGTGYIANGYRRILLDEIPTRALCVKNCILKTNDGLISHEVFCKIRLVRLFEDADAEYYIKVAVQGSEPFQVLSNHILSVKTNKPAPVEQDVEICTISPNTYFHVFGITTDVGIGRDHVCYSAVVGTVTYEPTDVVYVHYLNDRGFIEANLRCIHSKNLPSIEKSPGNSSDIIVWNDEYAKKMSMVDKKYSEKFRKIKYTGPYHIAEKNYSDDFIITFKSENPAETFKKATEVYIKAVQMPELTLTAGETINHFCQLEVETPVFANYDDNNYKLTISHIDHENIKKKAIEKILGFLKA